MTEAGPAGTLERIRARIGWEGPPHTALVEAGHVRRFCEAIGDDNPRWLEEVPPTFLVALGRAETPDVPGVLDYGRGWLNGGDRFEYLEPVRIGDRVTATVTLREAYEKDGRTGRMLFLVFETTYSNQHGRVVMRNRGTRIRR